MNDYAFHLFEELRGGRMTRRELIRRATVFGLSAPAVASLLAATGERLEPRAARREVSPTPGGTGRFGVTTPATFGKWGTEISRQSKELLRGFVSSI